MSLQDVIGDVLLAGTLIAAAWLGWLTPELAEQGFTQDDVAGEGALPAVCLWPAG